jgi:hypothetical protein
MIFGYLDPVTGSALLQVGLGALAALGLGWQYVRKFSRTLLARFRGESSSSADGTTTDLTEAETTVS